LPADLGPVLWYVHDFVGTRPVAAALLRRAARRVSLALANSRAVAADLGKALPGVPVEVVYYGIDAERFAPGPGAGPWLDDLAGLPAAAPGTVRVGLVATYARWKGHDVFLRAAGEVIREVAAPVRFYVVGGPIYHTAGSQYTRAELADLAAAAGLAGRIGFVPFQKDTPAVYRSLDVVVHASTRPEPFGRTIVEAMACGGAVILARAGGAAEIGTPGADLLATPPGDVAALTHALAILIRQPELRARLGERGRQTVLARFSRARLGREMRAVYRRLSGRPR
jgi:glycosyltransferase involved in cell wall biosynthesis